MENRRNPWLSFFLSLLQPGLGHIYNGSAVLGLGLWAIAVLLFLLGTWFFAGTFVGLMTFFVMTIGYRVSIAVHASRRARANRMAELRWYQSWFVYAVFAIVTVVLLPLVLAPIADTAMRYRAFKIPTSAMEPTLQVGDYLYADTWCYRQEGPQRGDVIAFRYPRNPEIEYVKRCIAVPGDTIEIRDKQVYLNGSILDEDYVVHKDPEVYSAETPEKRVIRDQIPPTVIPEGSYFVLGDNRDNSMDSRYFGLVPHEFLRGRLKYIYWSGEMSRLGRELGPKI